MFKIQREVSQNPREVREEVLELNSAFILLTKPEFVGKEQHHWEVFQRLLRDVANLVIHEVAWEQYGQSKYLDINIVAPWRRVQAFGVEQKNICTRICPICIGNRDELAPHPNTFCTGLLRATDCKTIHSAQDPVGKERLASLKGSSHRHDGKLARLMLLKCAHSLRRDRKLTILVNLDELDGLANLRWIRNGTMSCLHISLFLMMKMDKIILINSV